MNIIDHIKNKVMKVKQEDNKQEEILKSNDEKPSIFFPDKQFEECVKVAEQDEEAKEFFKTIKNEINKYEMTKFEVGKEDSIIITKRMMSYKNKLEKLISGLIEKNPNILFLVDDEHNQNLGMITAKIGMEDITLKILDNPNLSCMQDDEGKNIGMLSALSKLKKATSKALDNPIASTQQDQDRRNIGMYCAMKEDLVEETIKALDNKKASLQQDKFGHNIGMKAAIMQKNREVFEKALENTEACLQQDVDGENIGMYLVRNIGTHEEIGYYEDILLKALDNEFACMQQDKKGYNIGMKVALNGFKQATLKALDNLVASNQQNMEDGFNIGMLAAINIQDDEVDFKSLSNSVASVQTNKTGDNIGMLVARNFSQSEKSYMGTRKTRNPEVLIFALQNTKASSQQNNNGHNIGMALATNENVPDYVLSFALKNREASIQQNRYGINIGMFIVRQGRSKEVILEAMENEDALRQESYDNDTILSLCEERNRNDVFIEIINRGLNKNPLIDEHILNIEGKDDQLWRGDEINIMEMAVETLMKKHNIETESKEFENLTEESVMEE